MKYVEGRAVDSVVSDMGAQSVPFVRGVIGAAGKALHYAHSRGVVHRDVKPANFMLDKDGWLVVTDFGIAKMDDTKGLTMTGSVIGTPYYMAPEQFQGKPVTSAADQYALGVVAFELLTGRQPFAGDTVAEVMKGHLFDPIPSVRTLRPDVPDALDATITRMLSKDPADRFANLDEAVAAFGGVTATQENEVRTQMINLAISGAMEKPQIHVPVSPSPAVRQRPKVSQVDRTMPIAQEPGGASSAGVGHRSRSPWVIAVLALVIGGVLATAALRPDLVNRLRKNFDSGQGGLAETGRLVINESATPQPEVPVDTVDPAKRERELRDSIEQAVAASMRDSLARVDSARRADSAARVEASALARRQRRQEIIRDSLAALAEARRRAASAPTAVPAPAPPAEIPSTMVFGVVRIGSNCPGAVLLVNGEVREIVRRRILDVQQLSGRVRLEVRTLSGIRWDTTLTVASGVTHTIGFRPARCQ
jgi:serine/threonine-protein kinase